MATVSGSITDLMTEVRSRGWTILPNDLEALNAFNRVARNVYAAPPADLDYLVSEINGGDDVQAAVAAASQLLGWSNTGVKSPDLFAHIVGCAVLIFEKKTINRVRRTSTRKGLLQMDSMFLQYSCLHERDLAHQWLSANTQLLTGSGVDFQGADFDRFGGLGLLHISRIDSYTKGKLLHNIMVRGRPRGRNTTLILERRPYKIVVEGLSTRLTRQVPLT